MLDGLKLALAYFLLLLLAALCLSAPAPLPRRPARRAEAAVGPGLWRLAWNNSHYRMLLRPDGGGWCAFGDSPHSSRTPVTWGYDPANRALSVTEYLSPTSELEWRLSLSADLKSGSALLHYGGGEWSTSPVPSGLRRLR